ncbi:MAG: SPOR domain-containing protein [Bacteroidota bacterium]
MKLVLIFLFLIKISFLSAQNVTVTSDPAIEQLAITHTSYNKQIKGVDGYRVQIYFNSGNEARKSGENIKNSFSNKYPSIDAYLSFDQPYFKVRVGNYRTRIEADCFLKQIEKDFPGSFVVKDFIEAPKRIIPVETTE